MIRLKKRYRLDKVVSKGDFRPTLKFIKIEGDRAIATDGYILANVPIENSDGKRKIKNLLLNPAAWLRAVKNKKQGDKYLVETVDETNKKGSKIADLDMPDYPNWEKTVPSGKKHKIEIGLNAEYLYDLSQALGEERIILSIDPKNPEAAILTRPFCNDAEEEKTLAFGLIMPIRLEDNLK